MLIYRIVMHRRLLWLTAILATVASLITMAVVDRFLDGRIGIIGSFMGLEHARNTGIAFSLQLPLQNLVILAALVFVTFIACKSAKTSMAQIGFGLILGGALGNVIDRMIDGTVTDYFQVGTFPIFNVADTFITLGVCLLFLEHLAKRSESRVQSSEFRALIP